ncbi:MAG: hypothetical protein OXF41_13615 [bacterium]|nr:hypothetical protein [Acidimicrobiia bacterium]MCY4370411.1 hypothetical protein [bacterium]
MTRRALEAAAADFVSILNDVVASAIDTDVRFGVGLIADGQRARIEASRMGTWSDGIPLVRADEDPAVPALQLRAKYMVELAQSGEYLRVVTSAVGLWVDVTAGRKRHRPLVRVEYDRHPRATDRPAAHVHLHANSPEMAWVYGSSGRAAPDLHALHFPVGGQQFRPTLEDFLLFLNRERLYTDFKPGWKREVLRSLWQWETLQAAATVKKYPKTAVGVLLQLGYEISPPGERVTQ